MLGSSKRVKEPTEAPGPKGPAAPVFVQGPYRVLVPPTPPTGSHSAILGCPEPQDPRDPPSPAAHPWRGAPGAERTWDRDSRAALPLQGSPSTATAAPRSSAGHCEAHVKKGAPREVRAALEQWLAARPQGQPGPSRVRHPPSALPAGPSAPGAENLCLPSKGAHPRPAQSLQPSLAPRPPLPALTRPDFFLPWALASSPPRRAPLREELTGKARDPQTTHARSMLSTLNERLRPPPGGPLIHCCTRPTPAPMGGNSAQESPALSLVLSSPQPPPQGVMCLLRAPEVPGLLQPGLAALSYLLPGLIASQAPPVSLPLYPRLPPGNAPQ